MKSGSDHQKARDGIVIAYMELKNIAVLEVSQKCLTRNMYPTVRLSASGQAIINEFLRRDIHVESQQ